MPGPSECALEEPALGQPAATGRQDWWWLLDRRPDPPARPLDDRPSPARPPLKRRAKAPNGHAGEPTDDGRLPLTQAIRSESSRTMVMRIGGGRPSVQDAALAIDHGVPLAAVAGSAVDPHRAIDPQGIGRDHLATVAATLAARLAGASGLAGEDRRRRTGRSSHPPARSLARFVAFQRATAC